MPASSLEKLFEHNNWANRRIIQACSALTAEQLDSEPNSATRGSIRATLIHLVAAQQSYLRLLTLPLEERLERTPAPAFAELEQSAAGSGEALLALARAEPDIHLQGRLQTRDGYQVEPWILLVQINNDATENREQIKSMLTALGLTPPDIDGWDFGEFSGAFSPVEPKGQG